METQFTERVRFNQLEEGDLFTFRKNGILTGDPDDELLRYDNIWIDCFGETKANALCYGGVWFKINNTRSWVWRVPNEKDKKDTNQCNGCKYEWAMPSYEKCHGCSRMYYDNYEKGE